MPQFGGLAEIGLFQTNYSRNWKAIYQNLPLTRLKVCNYVIIMYNVWMEIFDLFMK